MMHSAATFTAAVRVVEGDLSTAHMRAIEPRKLRAAGCHTLDIREPVRLGERDEPDIWFLHLLREAVSWTMRVNWSAVGLPAVEPGLVCHLQPPAATAPAAATAGRVWRDRYAYGRCYYRRGPGFVTIRDSRDPTAPARHVLDDPAALQAFPAVDGVVHLPSAPTGVQQLVATLAGEGLAIRLGQLAMLLPVRMRHWPVPFNVPFSR